MRVLIEWRTDAGELVDRTVIEPAELERVYEVTTFGTHARIAIKPDASDSSV